MRACFAFRPAAATVSAFAGFPPHFVATNSAQCAAPFVAGGFFTAFVGCLRAPHAVPVVECDSVIKAFGFDRAVVADGARFFVVVDVAVCREPPVGRIRFACSVIPPTSIGR